MTRSAQIPSTLLLTVFLQIAFVSAAPPNERTREAVVEQMRPYAGPHVSGVDTSTLHGKVMCGYQGWFAAEGDGAGLGWRHYAGHGGLQPGSCTFDLWPDVSELDADERYATAFKHADGRPAELFSPYNKKTVLRHFEWMAEYDIDGVFLQRFGVSLRSASNLNHRNVITDNVREGANRTGRTWAMMYDLSGLREGDIERVVMDDWRNLVDRMEIRSDPAYLHHAGRPMVAVWGIGFNDGRRYTLSECERLVRFLKDDPEYGNNTVMVGVPTGWRTLTRDALKDEKLHGIIRKADIVSPWTVGRYHTPQAARRHAEEWVKPDLAWCTEAGLDYLPVVFPGFSWHNMHVARGESAPLNQIPRLKGEFLWSQAVADYQAGARMLYLAMFDEIDEGTAIFKCTNDPPVGESPFVTYEGLPSDHYLRLAGRIGRMLRGEIEATREMPFSVTRTSRGHGNAASRTVSDSWFQFLDKPFTLLDPQ